MSLGDLLKKAGLKSSDMKRKEAHGTKDKAKDGSKIHNHHNRTECEVCQRPAPDVERYEHRNRLLDVQWMCIVCADEYKLATTLDERHKALPLSETFLFATTATLRSYNN